MESKIRLAGFNFTKVSIERMSDDFKDLKIDTNIKILEVIEVKPEAFRSKEQILGIKFSYQINYNEEIAAIIFEGKVLLAIDSKQSKEALKEWKNKKLPEELQMPLINLIIRKSNVRALSLEDELNLPYHVPFPSVKKGEAQKQEK